MTDELLTRPEAAKALRCSVGRLRSGWGPRPLEQFKPRIFYRRSDIDAFIAGDPCDSSDATAKATGASGSGGAATPSRSQRERQIAAKLRSELAPAVTRSAEGSPRTSSADEESA
jgi:hypothetical protein